ncbi:FAD-binding oxidoreductase (plasmid) [Mycobacterium dioxanotrophicus]|uniref:FAD-binding oxidoreductase n=1 Tax=Mycobacterium dioxanotrophicus TaxID=482462 RepID=A0A1Y0CG73_9MYCO|nr:FAD-binding and (Fe-S)-binding domain-containing protein [Mycobacterium dioxanotrophicus]ART74288.1 FAD-binding oxidoreductase [Mycobacterium dioxanotrophicus]
MTEEPTETALRAALRARGVTDIDDSRLARAIYSSDASLYRVEPRLVVRPRHVEEIEATLAACREIGVPLTARGAGTSIAGNAIGPGVILDSSRHLRRIVDIDVESRTAVVEPGVVQAQLQMAAQRKGLRFGPDPSTHNRCTIGGMIGNNACGSRALAYGRTSDNVLALDIVDGRGRRISVAHPTGVSPSDAPTSLAELHTLVQRNLSIIRTQFGQFARQGSGYALEHLLPENRFDVCRALVGSEGTLALVERATVRLVSDPRHRIIVALGYPSIAEAADAAPQILQHKPIACEGLDERIVAPLRRRTTPIPQLPRGAGWLLVELAGDELPALHERAGRVVADAAALDTRVVTDPAETAAIWQIREDGAGLAALGQDGRRAHAGWEDAAVPVRHLGGYLRDMDALLAQHGLSGAPYGHFGDGCVHQRLDFPFYAEPDRGRTVFRTFLTEAAELVAHYGGSLSGEHGDGRARSELLPIMFSPDALSLFSATKAIFDPGNILNPGVLVRPRPLDWDIRNTGFSTTRTSLALRYPDDSDDFATAVHRCTGVAKCRVEQPRTGHVMCPSYTATRDEKDSTRGRARVLQEMTRNGTPDWRAPEVHEALDLCLSCKGCSSDCPTGVDVATWKSEVLHHAYHGRRRPLSHYTLGRLPQWADLAARTPRLVNRLTSTRWTARIVARAAGVDPRRDLPRFADRTFGQQWADRRPTTDLPGDAPRVLVWVDSFTDHFAPQVAHDTLAILQSMGHDADVVTDACCGLTWITTGQLDTARSILERTTHKLLTATAQGQPIIALEPSCAAVLRHDGPLLIDDPSSRTLATRVRTLAEHLAATPEWQPPDWSGTDVVAQPHCHHHAVMGWNTDAEVLRQSGAHVTQLGGCCGLAGNWGAERGHHDLSHAIAGQQLLPALTTASESAVVIADGFSCRTQIAQFSNRRAVHLSHFLSSQLTNRTQI